MKTPYQTPARRALLSLFSTHPHRQFTAEQVCTLLCQTNEQGTGLLGKSTVYRQLNRLCEQGALLRFEDTDPDGGAVHVYQYVLPEQDCATHFHLKCLRCGKVTHLDCDKTDHLIGHVRASHGLSIDCGTSILYGLCSSCEQKQPKEG